MVKAWKVEAVNSFCDPDIDSDGRPRVETVCRTEAEAAGLSALLNSLEIDVKVTEIEVEPEDAARTL